MSFKKLLPKKVELVPTPTDDICQNKYCRCRLRGKYKKVIMPNGYEAPICMRCFMLVARKGFRYKDVDIQPPQLKGRHAIHKAMQVPENQSTTLHGPVQLGSETG